MTERELLQRAKAFSLRIIKLAAALSENSAGRVVGNQLLRSGTSVGANYRAACRGRSRAEFVSKLGIVEEEADESTFWLELVVDAGLLPFDRVRALLQESREITAIMVASRKSAKRSGKSL